MNPLMLVCTYGNSDPTIGKALADGCWQCDNLDIPNTLARPVRHRVGTHPDGAPHDQVRVVCCGCHKRLRPVFGRFARYLALPEYTAEYGADGRRGAGRGVPDAARASAGRDHRNHPHAETGYVG